MEEKDYKYAFKSLEDVDDDDIYFNANISVEKKDLDNKSIFNESFDLDYEKERMSKDHYAKSEDEIYTDFTVYYEDHSGFEYETSFGDNRAKAIKFAEKIWEDGDGAYARVIVMRTITNNTVGEKIEKIIWQNGQYEDADRYLENLEEGTSSVYLDLLHEYHDALNKAQKSGNVIFTVDLDGDEEKEFDTWDQALKYAKEKGFDKIHVSSFGFEGPDGYDNGDYEEYDDQFLDLNMVPVKESISESIIVPLNDEKAIQEAKEELEEDEEEPVLEVTDLDANVEAELEPQKEYAGDYTLKCTKCGDLRVIKADDLVKDEETGLYNVEDVCAHCNTADGWELIGQLTAAEPEEVTTDELTSDLDNLLDEFTDEDEAELPDEDTTDYNVEPLADDTIEDEEIVEESFKRTILNHLTETFDNVADYDISAVSYDEDENKIILEGIISYTSGNKVNSTFELTVSRKDNNIILEGNNNVLSKDNKAFTFLCESVDKKLTNKELDFNYNYKGKDLKGKING